jgi:esterase/lipase superfamily enzyme
MRRDEVWLYSPAVNAEGNMVVYGHYGRPLLAFPTEDGTALDYEQRGMIESVSDLIEAGRVKVYAVASFDSISWNAKDIPLEERARRHSLYEDWILNQVVPWIRDDCGGGAIDIMTTGPSFGGYHAANFAFKHPHIFPLAICQSGVYDIEKVGWGERGDHFYFNNPMYYVSNLEGDHLEYLRGRLSFLLMAGQGQWEDTTGALESTKQFAKLLESKGIRHELDLWGHDVPHDWPSWRAQLAHHLHRFV